MDVDLPPPRRRRPRAGLRLGTAVCILVAFVLAVAGIIVAVILLKHSDSSSTTTTTGTTTTGTTTGTTTTGVPLPTGAAIVVEQPAVVEVAFLCNLVFQNGTCRTFFTYNNHGPRALTIARGLTNYVEPHTSARVAHTTRFEPGLHIGADTFVWDCTTHSSGIRRTVHSAGAGGRLIESTAFSPAAPVACPTLRALRRG